MSPYAKRVVYCGAHPYANVPPWCRAVYQVRPTLAQHWLRCGAAASDRDPFREQLPRLPGERLETLRSLARAVRGIDSRYLSRLILSRMVSVKAAVKRAVIRADPQLRDASCIERAWKQRV